MTKAIAKTYNIANYYSKNVFYSCLILASLFLLSYCFGVYEVITHTVSLQKSEKLSSELSLQVQTLDKKYMELSNVITPETIARYGLREVEVKNFIEKNSSIGRLARSGHEL